MIFVCFTVALLSDLGLIGVLITTAVTVPTLLLLVVSVFFLISSTLLALAERVSKMSPTSIFVGFILLLLSILFVRGLFYVEGLPITFVVVEGRASTLGWFTSLCRGGVPFGFSEQVRGVCDMYTPPYSGDPLPWGLASQVEPHVSKWAKVQSMINVVDSLRLLGGSDTPRCVGAPTPIGGYSVNVELPPIERRVRRVADRGSLADSEFYSELVNDVISGNL